MGVFYLVNMGVGGRVADNSWCGGDAGNWKAPEGGITGDASAVNALESGEKFQDIFLLNIFDSRLSITWILGISSQ